MNDWISFLLCSNRPSLVVETDEDGDWDWDDWSDEDDGDDDELSPTTKPMKKTEQIKTIPVTFIFSWILFQIKSQI